MSRENHGHGRAVGRLQCVLSLLLVLCHSRMAAAEQPADAPPLATSDRSAEPQTAPSATPSQSSVRPPVAVNTAVKYPLGAEGNSVVVLVLVVGVSGRVLEAEVLNGEEPFASAAVEATPQWMFTPAQRGERPVAVRIEMEVYFAQEVKQELGPPVAAPPAEGAGQAPRTVSPKTAESTATGGSARAVESATEVVVAGQRALLATTLTRAEARQVPGAFGDPMRAVETLPGVSTVVTGLPLYYVRGAPPGNIGFLIDGVRVPFLFHAFLGPSVIHPEIIERVNLHAGPYPAQFGRLAGAVVAADLPAPRRQLRYGGSLGVFDAGAYAETPFADGRGNLWVGGRYSYTGLLVSAFTPNELAFWNYQALVEYELTPQDVVGAFVLGGFDFLEDQEEQFFGREFHRIDLRYDRYFGQNTSVRFAVTGGIDRTRLDQGRVLDQIAGARVQLQHQVSDNLAFNAGTSLQYDNFKLDLNSSVTDFLQLTNLFRARTELVVGGYAGLVWAPEPWIRVTPGVRFDWFRSGDNREVGVDPRLAVSFEVTDNLRLVHGVGLSHQLPNYIPNIPGARVAGLDGGLQRALHTTSGAEFNLPWEVRGKVDLFHNAIFDATDPFSATQDFAIDEEEIRRRPLARAYGVEFSFRRPLTRRLGAIFSYTLSRSIRTYDTYETLSGADRTHVLNLGALYTLGSNWRIGGRSVYYSGTPGRLEGDERVFDQERAASFFRLDLRLERRFPIGPKSYWSFVAEGLNVTFSQESLRKRCSPEALDPAGRVIPKACTDTLVGPITLPNLRLEAHF